MKFDKSALTYILLASSQLNFCSGFALSGTSVVSHRQQQQAHSSKHYDIQQRRRGSFSALFAGTTVTDEDIAELVEKDVDVTKVMMAPDSQPLSQSGTFLS